MHPLSPRKTPICIAVALLAGCLLALCLSGCAGSGTRYIESIGVQGTVSQEETGRTTGTGGFTIQFRDGRDAKTIRLPKVSWGKDEGGRMKEEVVRRIAQPVIEAVGATADLSQGEHLLEPENAPFPLVVTRIAEEAQW